MYRRYRISPIWQEMDRMQREMNRMLETYTPVRYRSAPGFPALNVWHSDDGLTITAEVPGVRPEDMDISVVGDTLTLSGQRKADEVGGEVRYHRQERGYGRFSRTIQLPFSVETEQVEATFKNGVLSIALPRAEEEKPRKIAVKTV